jgi:hypothetical protein
MQEILRQQAAETETALRATLERRERLRLIQAGLPE